MKKDMLKTRKSSFLSVDKDLSEIAFKILSNLELQKLLYYTTKDCLDRPALNQEQVESLFDRNVKISPFIEIDKDILNYIFISFDDFIPNKENPYYRDNIIYIDIICHKSQWNLGDFKIRPYKIAGLIDGMLNNQKFSGIGELQFQGASTFTIEDQMSGLALAYYGIHGGDDFKVEKSSS